MRVDDRRRTSFGLVGLKAPGAGATSPLRAHRRRASPKRHRSLVGRLGPRMTGADDGNQHGMARLENYSFGRLMVDGQEHTRDLIVLPERVVSDWRRREGHSLAIEDL